MSTFLGGWYPEIFFELDCVVTFYVNMAYSKTKFNIGWLKKKDANGHLLECWCDAHETDKFKAVCKLFDQEIQVANNGYHALLQCAGEKATRKNQ